MLKAEIDIAHEFLKRRIEGHRKDVAICLRGYRSVGSNQITHAYFPAFMISVGFADLLSGLLAGKTNGQGRQDLQNYVDRFMSRQAYPRDAVDVLYEGFRHKVAHLGHPYFIFDTATKKHVIDSRTKAHVFIPPYKRYGWAFYASARKQPLELSDLPAPQKPRNYSPWPVTYNAIIKVSVRSFSKDLVASVFKPNGYFSYLQSSQQALSNFMSCMREFYPT